jgi:hypothetical protein
MKSSFGRLAVSLTVALVLLVALTLAVHAAGSDFQRSTPVRRTTTTLSKATALPCALKATPSKTKGQIDLSWTCTSRSLRGTFLVENSTNSKTWANVKDCTQSASSKTSYKCADTKLTSKSTYYYRLCVVSSAKTTKCGTTDVTAAVKAKAP